MAPSALAPVPLAALSRAHTFIEIDAGCSEEVRMSHCERRVRIGIADMNRHVHRERLECRSCQTIHTSVSGRVEAGIVVTGVLMRVQAGGARIQARK